jgi:hypothetical protein
MHLNQFAEFANPLFYNELTFLAAMAQNFLFAWQ